MRKTSGARDSDFGKRKLQQPKKSNRSTNSSRSAGLSPDRELSRIVELVTD